MKYNASCYIDFFDDGLKLNKPIKYKVQDAEIEIKSVNFSRLIVDITSNSNNKDNIYTILEEISNIFCFYKDMLIKAYDISTISEVIENDSGKTIIFSEFVKGSEKVLVNKTIMDTKELRNFLIYNNNKRELHTYISLYKEAICKKDPVSKYLLLYRLFDPLFNSDLKKMTSWIKLREPNIIIYPKDRNHPSYYTIFTKLRDTISHMKSRTKLPYDDIINFTVKLNRLVKTRIKEVYSL